MYLVFIVSLICTICALVKEKLEPEIPAEYWANKELYHEDVMNCVPIEERMKNLQAGKYKLSKEDVEKYPEPHRDPVDGKIVIENCKLYNSDLFKHGAVQTMKWVEQGKYNLTPEELEKVNEEFKKEMEKLYNY